MRYNKGNEIDMKDIKKNIDRNRIYSGYSWDFWLEVELRKEELDKILGYDTELKGGKCKNRGNLWKRPMKWFFV